jgi:lipopolysaccharide/colanic/teichoic acid biosynthesis glycosyltransferase
LVAGPDYPRHCTRDAPGWAHVETADFAPPIEAAQLSDFEEVARMRHAVGRVVAFLVCIVGFPIHLMICLAIKLGDGGPALYRDKRVGRGKQPFTMFKYRSMKVNCAPMVRAGSKVIVEDNDPRVTRVGRVLRCGIDELAQIANIARGELGWIGPRPVPVAMLPKYGPIIGERFQVDQGITGLAQVLHSRHGSSAQAFAIDLWYVRHRNPGLDLWIIAATPLFICGWRTVGEKKLRKLRAQREFIETEQRCQMELGPGVGVPTAVVQ